MHPQPGRHRKAENGRRHPRLTVTTDGQVSVGDSSRSVSGSTGPGCLRIISGGERWFGGCGPWAAARIQAGCGFSTDHSFPCQAVATSNVTR